MYYQVRRRKWLEDAAAKLIASNVDLFDELEKNATPHSPEMEELNNWRSLRWAVWQSTLVDRWYPESLDWR
jgi:hypothetical protein